MSCFLSLRIMAYIDVLFEFAVRFDLESSLLRFLLSCRFIGFCRKQLFESLVFRVLIDVEIDSHCDEVLHHLRILHGTHEVVAALGHLKHITFLGGRFDVQATTSDKNVWLLN
jgi:hypothetical protein